MPAFTEGMTTYFASDAASLAVATHEAAHQLQNAGVTYSMGLDPEEQAARVEHRVRRGAGATGLLGRQGSRVGPARRAYTEVSVPAQSSGDWAAGVSLRVSEDGHMAAEQDGTYGTHKLWATPALVTTSNGVLTSRRSVIQLGSGAGTLAGPPPDGTPVTRLLREVVPENVVTKTGGDTITLWADCGRAARDVLGVGGGTGKNHGKVTATYAASGRTVETSASLAVRDGR